jgi:hypothetical protein
LALATKKSEWLWGVVRGLELRHVLPVPPNTRRFVFECRCTATTLPVVFSRWVWLFAAGYYKPKLMTYFQQVAKLDALWVHLVT